MESVADWNDREVQPIKNLIVTTIETYLSEQLRHLRDRLGSDSVIYILSPLPISYIQQVFLELWPDRSTRPSCRIMPTLLGFHLRKDQPKNHFCPTRSSFRLRIGPLFHNSPSFNNPTKVNVQDNYLLNILQNMSHFKVEICSQEDTLYVQFRHLVLCSIVDPVTVIYECKPSEVIMNEEREHLVRSLLVEAARVLVFYSPHMTHSHLEYLVNKRISTSYAEKSTWMGLWDGGRTVTVDLYNGHIVRLGKMVGIACPEHENITQLIKRKCRERELFLWDKRMEENRRRRLGYNILSPMEE